MSRIRLEAGGVPFPGLKLIQLRGRGGFAEVWEAEDPQGELIAVKFMLSRNSTSSVKEMRIIQAVQKLTHRHLLRIRDVWSIPDYIVVAMELADGSLFDLFDVYQTEYGTALPPSLLAGYLRQAASGLDFLNTRRHIFDGRPVGFMHCDVKPSNILLVGEVDQAGRLRAEHPDGGPPVHLRAGRDAGLRRPGGPPRAPVDLQRPVQPGRELLPAADRVLPVPAPARRLQAVVQLQPPVPGPDPRLPRRAAGAGAGPGVGAGRAGTRAARRS